MTLVSRWRAARVRDEIAVRAREHDAASSDQDAARLQLDKLNVEWARAASRVPYWRDQIASGRFPSRWSSLEQFRTTVPPTTRSMVQKHGPAMACPSPPPTAWRTTGGSTSQPIRIPAWESETAAVRPDNWIGRGWYGITPASRLFLIWGHAHLLGSGWRGRVRSLRARTADRALGYRRFSAYDLRPDRLRAAAEMLLRFRPDYVVGYSAALDRFARENEGFAPRLRALKLRVIVGTAESFPAPDSVARLEQLFDCPVAMEYGTVETGVIAHTRGSSGFDVFWNTHLVDVEPAASGATIRVTSLIPRCFPLIRYELGDEVVPQDGAPPIGLRHFTRVIGRCNDSVTLGGGAIVHSELFTHAVRTCPQIRGFQVVQEDTTLRIRYLSEVPIGSEAEAEIRSRLARIHPELAGIALERASSLMTTIAGKTRMIVRP